jgi:hypothetical protein
MTEQKSNLAHLFLQGFVEEIVRNTPLRTLRTQIGKDSNMRPKGMTRSLGSERSKYTLEFLPGLDNPIKTASTKKQFNMPRNIHIVPPAKGAQGEKQRNPTTQRYAPSNLPSIKSSRIYKNKIVARPGKPEATSMTKLNFLTADPAVTEIECQGAEKPLLVRKGGVIQRTHVALTEKEITDILSEFSTKTKIPIIQGTFKVATGNLIMIAIISEILGPRFIIQKRNPFQPLLPQ